MYTTSLDLNSTLPPWLLVSQNETSDEHMISIARAWIFFISPFGIIGNFITALTIIHQFILRGRKCRRGGFSNIPGSVRSDTTRHSQTPPDVIQGRHRDSPVVSARCSLSQRTSLSHGSLTRDTLSNASSRTHVSLLRVEGDTLLILHLTICDLIYCSICLPHTAYVFAFDASAGGEPYLCAAAAFVRYVSAYAEWLTLGLLTVQRCVDMTRLPSDRFFRFRSTLAFIVAIWLFSILLQLANLLRNQYGYSRVSRKCDIIASSKFNLLQFYTLHTFIPCSLMLFGCFSIIRHMIKNKKRLQELNMSSDMLREREREMLQLSGLILGLLLLFLLCVLPICVYYILVAFEISHNFKAGIILFMIYWVQYGINFIVYAASHNKYRRAYRLFFGEVWARLKAVFGLGPSGFAPSIGAELSAENSDSSVFADQPVPDMVLKSMEPLNGNSLSVPSGNGRPVRLQVSLRELNRMETDML